MPRIERGHDEYGRTGEDRKKLAIRQERDARIAATDYLILEDYLIEGEALNAVKEYRQKLRDVPEQAGFPEDVEWPEMPEITKA